MEVQILEDYPVSFGAAVFSAFLPSLWEFHCTSLLASVVRLGEPHPRFTY